MGLFDKLMNTFSVNDDEDEYYDDDDFVDEEEEEEEEPPQRKGGFASKNKEKEKETSKSSKITPMRTAKRSRSEENEREITMFRPTADSDVCDIIDALLSDRTVVLNLEGINENLAEKVIHMVSGATYALSGNMVKISSFIFIIAPKSVELSGDSGSEAPMHAQAPQQARPYEFARVAGGRY